jgi:hypothetical protein
MKTFLRYVGLLLITAASLPLSTAYASQPYITASTFCAGGHAALGWTVSSWSNDPVDGEHPHVIVEASVDNGPWTIVGSGAFASPVYGFSGQVVLPQGSLSVRARVTALGPWASGVLNERAFYALPNWTDEGTATALPVPANCAFVNPGTGTPGYWKNHPNAWPVDEIVLGGVTLTRTQAIGVLSTPTAGDATYILARALIAAELNALIGNDTSCIGEALDDAQAWFIEYPVGSRVRSRDAAWTVGGALAGVLDAYNNGELCAPHRN